MLLVLAGVGYGLLQSGTLSGQIPGMDSTANTPQDQGTNDQRNADLLAAEQAVNSGATPEPAVISPPPDMNPQPTNSVPVPPSDLGEPPPVQDVVPQTDAATAPPPAEVGEVPPPATVEAKRPHKTAKKAEGKATKKSPKSGLRVFSRKCEIRARPAAKSKVTGSVPKGKKLWVDSHDAAWGKVRTKAGRGYVSKSCYK